MAGTGEPLKSRSLRVTITGAAHAMAAATWSASSKSVIGKSSAATASAVPVCATCAQASRPRMNSRDEGGLLALDEVGQCDYGMPGQPTFVLATAQGQQPGRCRRPWALQGDVKHHVDVDQHAHRGSTHVLGQEMRQPGIVGGRIARGRQAQTALPLRYPTLGRTGRNALHQQ